LPTCIVLYAFIAENLRNSNFSGAGNDIVYAAKNGNTDDADARHIIYAGEGNDTVYGAKGDDFIDLDEDNNVVRSYGGNDEIIAGAGNDIIYAYDLDRSNDNDKVNYIDAGAGNDTVYGTQGIDTIIGGLGNDTLYGYAGSDLFIFSESAGKDIIGDFNVKEDKIMFTDSALSFDDLHFKAVNNDTVVSYLDSQITLRGVAISKIEESLFIF